MIKGLSITEKQYRKIPKNSASSLQDFAQSRVKYYKKHIVGEKEKEDEADTRSTLIGSLVHCRILEPENFDKKFHLSGGLNVPTGNMEKLMNALVTATEECLVDGIVTKEFDELFDIGYVASEYKITKEAVLKKFIAGGMEDYYQELRTARLNGLRIVSEADLVICDKVVERLKNCDTTTYIANLQNGDFDQEVLTEVQYEDFEIDGLPLKMMLDKVIFDHEAKTIQIWDFKVVWDVEGFFWNYFLKKKAYLQACVYWMGMCLKFPEYTVFPTNFIVADSTDTCEPLIYEMSVEDIEKAYGGFEFGKKFYIGLRQVIDELQWAIENDKWGISRENYKNNGIVKLFR